MTGTATNDVKRLGGVLNGGRILIGRNADTPSAPMSFTDDRKPVIYVTKPLDSLRADRAALTMTSSQRNLDGGYSPAQITSQRTAISVSVADDVMTMTSPYCVVKVIYVTKGGEKTRDSEEARIVEDARADAEVKAWRFEKARANSGVRGRWNERQVRELERVGKVPGFGAVFFWDVSEYPEFSKSGRDMDFVPT